MFKTSCSCVLRLTRKVVLSDTSLISAFQIKNFSKSVLQKSQCAYFVQQKRLYTQDSDPLQNNNEIKLMNFEPRLWPNIFNSLRNWFFAKVIIQPYFDKDFTMTTFVSGAKQALVTISSHLAAGRLDLLEGLVTNEALQEIQKNYSQMDVACRMSLAVSPEDIFFFFPYQIGIILNDESKQRFAEIFVVFHCMKDFKNAIETMREEADYKKLVTVCNYRFIREYTKGTDSDWTVNLLNHFNFHTLPRK